MATIPESLAGASLTVPERRTLEHFVTLLRARLGADVHAVWLYGSRARGEPIRDESDVDVLVVTTGGLRDLERVGGLVFEAAGAGGADPVYFGLQLYTPEEIAQRREIRSFFIQEVDRDKIVLLASDEPPL